MTNRDPMTLSAARPPVRRAPLLRRARAGPVPRTRFVADRLTARQRHRLEVAPTHALTIATTRAFDRPLPARNVACRPDSPAPVGNVSPRPAAPNGPSENPG